MNTIAAISTPNAPGGIAMIRISGDDALPVAARVFRAAGGENITQMRGYSCCYGYIFDGDEQLDDVVLTVFRAPHSYTGEDTVEITCHGGIYLTKRILALILQNGAELAPAGEYTKRSFLNGKLSLSQAEAVMDVIQASGAAALRQANEAKSGRLGKQMKSASDTLVDIMSAFAYWMDDPEEFPPELDRQALTARLDTVCHTLQKLAAGYDNGRVLREGIRTVLLGRPNAGKSSVMNWLCGMSRSIVTDIAGTTRDVITEHVKLGDYTLLLSDTAGIRGTENAIEAIGISQAISALESADLVLYVIDASVGVCAEDYDILAKCPKQHTVILWNKIDLADTVPPVFAYPVVQCSALQADADEALMRAVSSVFGEIAFSDYPVAMNERQLALLTSAAQTLGHARGLLQSNVPLDMLYTELECAAADLRAFEGDSVSDAVIDGVFSKFCVGK